MCPGLACHSARNPIQPRGQGIRATDCGRLARQHEEDGLEGILGRVGIAEHPPADAQHHRAVPRHQRSEGILVAPCGEPAQEGGISLGVQSFNSRELARTGRIGLRRPGAKSSDNNGSR